MSSTTKDKFGIGITNFLDVKKDTFAPINTPTFEAKFEEGENIASNTAALLQVNIAEQSTGSAQLTAALKLLNKEFTSVTIFIDMKLALLIYSIIMPYMSEEQLQEIVTRKKLDWVQKNIPAINQLTIPWLIVTDNEKRIEKAKHDNTLKLKALINSDSEFCKNIQSDSIALKAYLADTNSINNAMYKIAQTKNDKAIESYLLARISVIEAMHAFNNRKHTYITTYTMCSYSYLHKITDMKHLPLHLTLVFTKISGSETPEILTSTDLNKKLHELGLLSKISGRKSYLEHSVKHFLGNVYIQSLNRTILTCNNMQCLALGVSDQKYLEGKTFESLFPQDESDKLAGIVNDINITNKTKVLREEYYYPLAKENIHFLTIKTPLRNKKNKTIGVIGFSIKMENKNEFEKLQSLDPEKIMQAIIEKDTKPNKKNTIPDPTNLKKVIAYMPGNVFWQSIDGQMMGCNNDHAKFLGFEKPEDLIGKYPSDFLTEEYAKEAKATLTEMAKTGKPVIKEEVYKAADGFTVMNSHKTPIKNNDGKVIGIIVVSFDISESRQDEIQLEEEKEKLEKDNSIKNKFVQDIEHDMRTPFVGLYSMTELCAHKETDKEKRKKLDQISNYAKELLTHCDSLLEFNKNGSFSNNANLISIKELIDSVVNTNNNEIKAKHLELDINYDKSIPSFVMGDPYRVKKILNYLISNASQRTHKGYIKLAVKLEYSSENVATISFTVSISAIRISKQDYSEKNINLNDVKRFVEDLRGEITIDYDTDRETSTTVTLNFIVPDDIHEENIILQKEMKQKILIVEDSRITAKFLEGITADLGCTNKTAATGKDAIRLIESEHFDVLLLDIDLEDTDGYTLARKIRMLEIQKQKPPIKIIMMTAQQSKLHPNRNTELNITECFVKPIKIRELINILQNITKPE